MMTTKNIPDVRSTCACACSRLLQLSALTKQPAIAVATEGTNISQQLSESATLLPIVVFTASNMHINAHRYCIMHRTACLK